MERTFFIIKPDAVARGLVGQVLERMERRGFEITDLRMMTASPDLIATHYDHLTDEPFFSHLVSYSHSVYLLLRR